MESLRILELFSGIGGMHYAFNYSGINGKIVAAIDINPVANTVYQHNHPKIELYNKNIQKINAKFIKKLDVNTILMSPPCQPFTRVGNKKDLEDHRSDAFKHICELLHDLDTIDYILMENVKGFELSKARDLYIKALKKTGFYCREFMLSPSQFGVPNTRRRYFSLARRTADFNFEEKSSLWETIPNNQYFINMKKPQIIDAYIEHDATMIPSNFYISDDILKKRVLLLDIVTKNCTNSICFTKAYTHYSEGTGSILSSNKSIQDIQIIFRKLQNLSNISDEYLLLLKELNLRYFTPNEVARLMCFPLNFQFPSVTTNRQKYRLLGNSINVLVVGELIKLLCQ